MPFIQRRSAPATCLPAPICELPGKIDADGASTAPLEPHVLPLQPQPRYSKRRRVAMAVAFSLGNAANAFLWICFAPVAQASARRFGVSVATVNQLSLLYLYAYAPGLLLSALVTQRCGLRANVATGAALNAACGWVRVAARAAPARSAFGVVAFGQALGAIGQPTFTNAPALLALKWCALRPRSVSLSADSRCSRFPPAEREHVVVWTAVSNVLGNAAGSALPGFLVTRQSEARDIDDLLLGQAIAVTALLAFTLAALYPPQRLGGAEAVRDEPAPEPRSARAAAVALWRDTSALLRTRAYAPLLVAVAVGVGLSIALLTLVAQTLEPCGFGADVASLAGGALLVAGVIAAGITGAVLTRRPGAAMALQRGLVLLLAAALAGALACLQPRLEVPLVLTWAAMGAAMIPLLPVSLQTAAAAASAVDAPADLAAGLMLLAGQWAGVGFVFAVPPLLALPPSADCSTVATPHAAFLLGNALVACAAILALRRPEPQERKADATAV